MNAIERVRCVLAGRRPDHPPVSFWHHFPPDRVSGPAALAAHTAHVEGFDLDFLKVMNDNGYPHAEPLTNLDDLRGLAVHDGDEPEFALQLDLLSDLKRALGDRVLMTTTSFNAYATLRRLVQPKKTHGPPVIDGAGDAVSAKIRAWYAEDAGAVRSALANIAASLAHFARRCVAAGADGVFLSVRDDWLRGPGAPPDIYDDLVRPGDLEILDAASGGTFNMLHVCGRAVDFRAFAAYPVHAINWADRAAGPAVSEVVDWAKPAVCGGVDNLSTLRDGSVEDCERQVRDALRQAGARPIMIGPGCTYDPDRVPRENLEAVCRAARGG